MNKTTVLLTIIIIAVLNFVTGAIIDSNSYSDDKNQDTSAVITPRWVKGDIKTLTVKKSRERTVKGKESKGGSTSEVELQIIDDNAGYTLEWTYKKAGTSDKEGSLGKRLAQLVEGLKVIYKIDASGEFQDIVNTEEILDYLDESIDMMEKILGGDDAAVKACDMVKDMFSTKEKIEEMLIKEIRVYHGIYTYGKEFTLNEPQTMETELPNPLGGESFPAKVNIEMTSLKPDENYCKIIAEQEIDKEKATEIIYKWLENMSRQLGKPMPEDGKIPLITINDSMEYEVDLKSGWITRAYFKRDANTDQGGQVDTVEITAR